MKKPVSPMTSQRGFTLIEVMMASFVMVVMFISALAAIQQGFQLLDTARNTTLAGQIIQSEIEDIRLRSWANQPVTGSINLAESIAEGLTTAEREALVDRFTATRTVSDIRTNFRRIVINVAWTDYSGRPHNRAYETCVGRNGLSDYFVTTHSTPPSTP